MITLKERKETNDKYQPYLEIELDPIAIYNCRSVEALVQYLTEYFQAEERN